MKSFLPLCTVFLIGLLTDAEAIKFAAPQDRTVVSPNGEYSLEIEAKSGRHVIRKGQKVLWSFKRKVWHDEYFLSDDGQCVLWVAWRFVKVEDTKKEGAIIVYSAKGATRQTYTEVSSPRRYREREIGPHGKFWRIWRDRKIARKGEVVSIPVNGKENAFRIDLASVSKEREGS